MSVIFKMSAPRDIDEEPDELAMSAQPRHILYDVQPRDIGEEPEELVTLKECKVQPRDLDEFEVLPLLPTTFVRVVHYCAQPRYIRPIRYDEQPRDIDEEPEELAEPKFRVAPRDINIDEEPTITWVDADAHYAEPDVAPRFLRDPAEEHPYNDTTNEESQALDVEKKLNACLNRGNFDWISEQVTPKILASCKTNPLLKAFEANKMLSDSAHSVNPEKEEIEKLMNSVNEFTSALINPLKTDNDTRIKFQSCFDYVVDKAIDTEQKKFLTHPVVYNLLNARWHRSFTSVMNKPWTSPSRWGYFFLNLWPVLDIFLFPFLFACFFLVHFLVQLRRKKKETEVCFVVTLSKDTTEEGFALIKRTVKNIIGKYGYQAVNYCLILKDENSTQGGINFGTVFQSMAALQKEVDELKMTGLPSRLCEDLCAARDAFKSSKVRKDAKKILFVFVNDMLSMVGARNNTTPLTTLVNELMGLGVKVVPVGIGEYAKLSELKEMVGYNAAFYFGEHESARTLAKTVIQDVEGKDIYEKYKDYFTTPFFIFFRDTLSYLTLLGLHFAVCLSPSTIAFSRLEWVILIFFIGRIVMEFDQFTSATKKRRKPRKPRHKSFDGSNYEVCVPLDEKIVASSSDENVGLKMLTNYFSDRWNILDFTTLVFYVITLTLRMIIWSRYTEVADNRPLAVAGCFYGFIAMFLTLRVFGHVMECARGMGTIQIALFFIIWDVLTIFCQFLATILAFSLAMTKIYVAEKSYTSKSGEGLACADGGFTCWWTMVKHLTWSLLGLAERDSLSSVDHQSVSLIHLLYILFLIMGVILLVNMMIALLSNTYQQVQDNSLKEWSFKMAITIKSYSSYHPVPVPFNLVSIPIMAMYRLWCDKSDLDESDTAADPETTLDKVVKTDLIRTYYATYGYSFPLTDEKKTDQLLHEVDGSRRMTNQIVRQVFPQPGSELEKTITGANAWESLGISNDGYLLIYKGPEFCDVCKVNSKQESRHGARCLTPFTQDIPRIEVLIQESGERRIIAVGAVYESYDYHWMPGWKNGTVGYHVDDGRIFDRNDSKLGREVEGAMAHRGDLISCEVDFDSCKDSSIEIVFSLNGKEVARTSMNYTEGETKLYPFISLGYEGIVVLAKMCPRVSSGKAQNSLFTEQRSIRGPGTELDRTEQARSFQQQLDDQREMLMEIRNLLLRLNEEKQKYEEANQCALS